MSIIQKTKDFSKKHSNDIFWFFIIFLTFLSITGLIYQNKLKNQKYPITLEKSPLSQTSMISASEVEEYLIIGNKNSKLYHLPGCSGAKTTKEQNRIYFNSEQEAREAGFKLAGNCLKTSD